MLLWWGRALPLSGLFSEGHSRAPHHLKFRYLSPYLSWIGYLPRYLSLGAPQHLWFSCPNAGEKKKKKKKKRGIQNERK